MKLNSIFLSAAFLSSSFYGNKLDRRYFDSRDATLSYPFMAMVVSSTNEVLCSAVMYGDRLALTAASCVDDKSKKYRVLKSSYHKDPNTKIYCDVTISFHPNYNKQLPMFHNIAVLTLSNSKSEGNLQLSTRSSYVDKKLVALGWGSIDYRGFSYTETDKLRKTYLKVIEMQNCTDSYTKHLYKEIKGDVGSQLCVGPSQIENMGKTSEGPRDLDMGGPLIEVDESGNPVLVGIAAFSGCQWFPCAPSFYASVGYYRSWINSFIVERYADNRYPQSDIQLSPDTYSHDASGSGGLDYRVHAKGVNNGLN